jgi:hypothetical protein
MTAAVAAAAASGDDAVSTCLICLEPDDADGSAQQRLLHGRRLRLLPHRLHRFVPGRPRYCQPSAPRQRDDGRTGVPKRAPKRDQRAASTEAVLLSRNTHIQHSPSRPQFAPACCCMLKSLARVAEMPVSFCGGKASRSSASSARAGEGCVHRDEAESGKGWLSEFVEEV